MYTCIRVVGMGNSSSLGGYACGCGQLDLLVRRGGQARPQELPAQSPSRKQVCVSCFVYAFFVWFGLVWEVGLLPFVLVFRIGVFRREKI